MLVRRKWRWREEDFLKYASENYGIDKICDYAAIIEVNTKITDHPARKAANAAIRDASQDHTHALSARTTGSRWRSRPRSSLWGARNLAPQKDDRPGCAAAPEPRHRRRHRRGRKPRPSPA